MQEYICNLNQLEDVAINISKKLKRGDIILLHGDLGTGKTTFTKLLVRHLGGSFTDVTSPTFNLVHQYKTKYFDVCHFDLYRLKSKEELYNIGIEQGLRYGVSVIEWGEIAKNFLPDDCIEIFFQYTTNSRTRKVLIQNCVI